MKKMLATISDVEGNGGIVSLLMTLNGRIDSAHKTIP
jgi:hypothetical protein